VFILEEPYVSDLLAGPSSNSACPCCTPSPSAGCGSPAPGSRRRAFSAAARRARGSLNSENGSADRHHTFGLRPAAAIQLFRTRSPSRHLVADLYRTTATPGCRGGSARRPGAAARAVLVKPAVGFFGLGVHMVDPPRLPAVGEIE
jgi:hypothetical protein